MTTTLARMEWDATESEWVVYDRDGDVDDVFADRTEARKAVNDLNAEYAEENRLEERDKLIDEIQGMVSESDDVHLLRKIRDMLKA